MSRLIGKDLIDNLEVNIEIIICRNCVLNLIIY